MGSTYEVEAYMSAGEGNYVWESWWTGEDFHEALNELRLASERHGAVRLVWRT